MIAELDVQHWQSNFLGLQCKFVEDVLSGVRTKKIIQPQKKMQKETPKG
jgi:hypothetical protein